MNPDRQILIAALRECVASIEETTGRLHFVTVEMPREGAWNGDRDEVGCLDSIGDVMR
jgi:hypothetical protein